MPPICGCIVDFCTVALPSVARWLVYNAWYIVFTVPFLSHKWIVAAHYAMQVYAGILLYSKLLCFSIQGAFWDLWAYSWDVTLPLILTITRSQPRPSSEVLILCSVQEYQAWVVSVSFINCCLCLQAMLSRNGLWLIKSCCLVSDSKHSLINAILSYASVLNIALSFFTAVMS